MIPGLHIIDETSLHADNYISASCVIRRNIAYRNGTAFFENKAADLQQFLGSLYQYLASEYPKFYKMDNLSKLGWLAAELLINKQPILAGYNPYETGVIISNSNSSLDVDLRYLESTRQIPSPALFVYTLPNIMIGEICIRHRIKGENAFFISPEFDAPFIAQYVNNLINNNILQVCICGWVELMGDDYKAVLLLVEKDKGESQRTPTAQVFNEENIKVIYQL
ncbi:MAG: hypothetical protein H7Y03_06495 [Chitinophagaceae bacterium]|nr:hypothetical protein [Chitinophagaceae bacterium]